MQSFEEFKKARLAMDPTSRQLTDLQWDQAYEAHKSSRQRVKGGSSQGRSSESSGKSRKQSSSRGSGRGSRESKRHKSRSSAAPVIRSTSASLTKSGVLLWRVREASAYGDIRLLVNLLAYVLLAIVVIAIGVKVTYLTSAVIAVSTILQGVVQAAGIFVLRYLAHVLIDIPDILLYRELQESDTSGEENASVSPDDTAT